MGDSEDVAAVTAVMVAAGVLAVAFLASASAWVCALVGLLTPGAAFAGSAVAMLLAAVSVPLLLPAGRILAPRLLLPGSGDVRRARR